MIFWDHFFHALMIELLEFGNKKRADNFATTLGLHVTKSLLNFILSKKVWKKVFS